MAGHKYNIAMPTYVNFAAATRTAFQIITPSTRRLWVLEYSVSFRSIAATDIPVIVRWVRQSTAGTSGATIVPAPVSPHLPAALATVNSSFSGAEPTDAAVYPHGPRLISPVGTTFDYPLPEGEEIEVPESGRLGCVVIPPQATDILITCTVME